MKSLPPEFNETDKAIAEEIAKSHERPFTVSIMGQTGVGKTSLLEALFNKVPFNTKTDRNFLVDHVRPATRKPETYTIAGENGQILVINDLPGIGESNSADQIHLDTYHHYFHPSDLVLWAIQADSRSITLDTQAFDHLLGKLDMQDQEQLMSKLIFILTKVDILLPTPWFMNYNKSSVQFSPSAQTRGLIGQKQEFFQEQLILPFGSHIVSHTYNDVNFMLDEPSFWYDDNKVMYRGFLTKKRVQELSEVYLEYKKVFERLYDNYCPVPCSTRFKYNLPQLMLVILNKLGSNAVQNFKRVVDLDFLNSMSLSEAKQLCNLLIWNTPDSRKIFDLQNGIFPDPRRDNAFYSKIVEKPRKRILGEPRFLAWLFTSRA